MFAMYWPAFSNRTTGKSADETELLTGNMAIEYAKQLTGFGLVRPEILSGLEKAKQRTFTPNPVEFRDLCLPWSLDAIVSEITDRRGRFKGEAFEWSHALVEQINMRVGFQLYQLSAERFRTIVKRDLDYWLQQIATGYDISKPKAALEIITEQPKSLVEQVGYTPKIFAAKAMMDRMNRIRNKRHVS